MSLRKKEIWGHAMSRGMEVSNRRPVGFAILCPLHRGEAELPPAKNEGQRDVEQFA